MKPNINRGLYIANKILKLIGDVKDYERSIIQSNENEDISLLVAEQNATIRTIGEQLDLLIYGKKENTVHYLVTDKQGFLSIENDNGDLEEGWTIMASHEDYRLLEAATIGLSLNNEDGTLQIPEMALMQNISTDDRDIIFKGFSKRARDYVSNFEDIIK